MELGLAGKNVLITGGASGLGKAIVLALAEEGANICFSYLRGDPAAVISQCEKFKTMVHAVNSDLSQSQEVKNLFKKTEGIFPQIDILINNSAIWLSSLVSEMQEEDWDKTMDLNLKAVFLLSQLFVNKAVIEGYPAKILNINSQAAFYGSTSGHAHYAASKAGMTAFQISLAREAAASHIQVNGLAVGIMDTQMVREQYAAEPKKYLERIPMGRIAQPKEIADVAAFLVSEKNQYMTGATVDVTGGMLMR